MDNILFLASYLYSIANKRNLHNSIAFGLVVIFTLPLMGVFVSIFILFKWKVELAYILAVFLPLGLYSLHRCSRFVLAHHAEIEHQNRLRRRPALVAIAILLSAWLVPISMILLARTMGLKG